jgi:hypothetical protein
VWWTTRRTTRSSCPRRLHRHGRQDSNGAWYIDVASCDVFGPAENDYVDDDLDGLINDGCPAVGAPESATASYACDPDFYSSFDGYLNDGCPRNRQCQGPNGFDNRWDFAFPGYGGASAQPVPADYGSIAGPAEARPIWPSRTPRASGPSTMPITASGLRRLPDRLRLRRRRALAGRPRWRRARCQIGASARNREIAIQSVVAIGNAVVTW